MKPPLASAFCIRWRWPSGPRSKMWANTPFTSGPGAVPTYTGTGAVPRQYLSPNEFGRQVKQRRSGIRRG